MKYSLKYPWWYNNRGVTNTKLHTLSIAWSVAHSLYWFLKNSGKFQSSGLRAIEMPSLDDLTLGDIIQYEDSSHTIYHSAIITTLGYERGVNIPFISQHSYDGLNITYVKPAAAKMHFMKIII